MITKNDKVSEVLNQNKSLFSVLERFGIGREDYHKTLEEAGLDHKTDPDFMLEILRAFDQENKPDQKVLMRFPIETILDCLHKTHTYYLEKKIPEIELSLHDFIQRHKKDNSVLYTLGNLFLNYKLKLTEHIRNEEEKLFPYIQFLMKQLKGDFDYVACKETLSGFSIGYFESSHNNVEEDIEMTRETIVRFSPEQNLAMSYRIFLTQLELFETDLHRHSIVEDEVLVPKALMLEGIVRGMMGCVESYDSKK